MSQFVRGYCVAICVNGLIQDLIGKDRYIESVKLLWINTSPFMWAAGILFFILPWETWLKRMDDRFTAPRSRKRDRSGHRQRVPKSGRGPQ